MFQYVPAKNDYVLAIVVNRSAETIKVDIGGSEYASLSCLAFENASKRNKPILDVNCFKTSKFKYIREKILKKFYFDKKNR